MGPATVSPLVLGGMLGVFEKLLHAEARR